MEFRFGDAPLERALVGNRKAAVVEPGRAAAEWGKEEMKRPVGKRVSQEGRGRGARGGGSPARKLIAPALGRWRRRAKSTMGRYLGTRSAAPQRRSRRSASAIEWRTAADVSGGAAGCRSAWRGADRRGRGA